MTEQQKITVEEMTSLGWEQVTLNDFPDGSLLMEAPPPAATRPIVLHILFT